MKKLTLVIAFAGILAASCTKSSSPEGVLDNVYNPLIEVGIPREMTKVALGGESAGNMDLVWSSGDQIAVIDGANKSIYRLVSGVGTKNGVFEYVSGNANPQVIKKVVYPSSASENVPTAQTYTTGTFDSSAAVLSYDNPEATNSSQIELQAKNSFVCFQLKGSDKLTSIKLAVDGGSTYTLSIPSVQLSSKSTPFHIVVPATASGRVDVTFISSAGEMTRILPSKAFEAGKMHRFASLTVKADRKLRIMTYNIGMCNKTLSSSPQFIANITKELNADVAVMNEVKSSLVTGYQDQTISSALGWNYYYKEAQNSLGNMITYGSNAGTKISESYLALNNITSEDGKYDEDRVCLFMEFDDYVLVGSHIEANDFVAHTTTITNQVKSKYAGKGKPVIFCGDMNTRPYSSEMKKFQDNWRIISRTDTPTLYNAELPKSLICIDYIFVWKGGPDVDVLDTQVCRSVKCGTITDASDHYPVYVDVKIGGSSLPILDDGASLDDFSLVEENW